MEGNNKTLLLAVLIILLAVVSFNFSNISGMVAGSKVDVYPKENICTRYQGSTVVSVLATGRFEKDFNMHNADDGTRMGGTSENLCTKSTCDGTNQKSVKVSCQPGRYFFRLKETGRSGDFVDSPAFTIRVQ